MIPTDGITLSYIKAAIKRRLWYVVVPFFLVIMATLIYCIRAPKIYRSSTLILVQPQEVPADYVRPTVTFDAKSRMHTLKEQVMSRPKLEEIIIKYDLYSNVRTARTMEDAVEIMREHIDVKVKESRSRWDSSPASFKVSYEGKEDPVKVRDVTAEIANLFIVDNMKLREAQAKGTSEFLERELETMTKELRHKEDQVRNFKEQHFGMLPDQMENNYRILAQLQQHSDSLNESLQQSEDRRVVLQTQLGSLESIQASRLYARGQLDSSLGDQRALGLDELRQQLESLRSRYSDRHPSVIKLKTIIDKREKEHGTTLYFQEKRWSSPRTEAQRLLILQKENLLTQLKLAEKEVEKLRKEKSHTSRQVEEYRRRIENGPRVEQMFMDLRRDYEEASENYQSLLEKKMQADLAEHLEFNNKGEQFTVLEPASLPEKPYKPNILKICLLGLMVACSSGVGLAFLREYLDQTYWSSKDLEGVLEIPVLASIPVITTTRQQRWNVLKKAGAVCALLVMCSAMCYALFVLWRQNPLLLPL